MKRRIWLAIEYFVLVFFLFFIHLATICGDVYIDTTFDSYFILLFSFWITSSTVVLNPKYIVGQI